MRLQRLRRLFLFGPTIRLRTVLVRGPTSSASVRSMIVAVADAMDSANQDR